MHVIIQIIKYYIIILDLTLWNTFKKKSKFIKAWCIMCKCSFSSSTLNVTMHKTEHPYTVNVVIYTGG